MALFKILNWLFKHVYDEVPENFEAKYEDSTGPPLLDLNDLTSMNVDFNK